MKQSFGKTFATLGFLLFVYHRAFDGFLDQQLEYAFGWPRWLAFVAPIAVSALLLTVAVFLLRQAERKGV